MISRQLRPQPRLRWQLARETGHTLNWVRCAGLAAEIALEAGDLSRADTILDQAEVAAGPQPFVLQKTAPRRARQSRLSGRPDDAERHLQSVAHLERANGLGPDRVVYLIEAAHCAQLRGDLDRAAALVLALQDAAVAVGIDLPLPEQRHLDILIGAGATSPS